MSTIITIILILWFCYWLFKKLTKPEVKSESKEPEKKIFSEELKKETQEEFYKIEKFYKSFKSNEPTFLIDKECLADMIENEELKYISGKVVTLDSLENHIRFREITEICLREEYNPRKKEDRELAEALLDLEEDDEEEDSSDDWDDYSEPSSSSSRVSRSSEREEYGSYVIQYRDSVGGSWIDGPGSNDERIAESMFDRFIRNDPRGDRRCRLVYKVNGKIEH